MLKKIKIMYATGERFKVWAWVDGLFGIHRPIGDYWTDGSGKRNVAQRKNLWTVTHLPTGMAMGDPCDKLRAKQKLDAVKAFKWRGRRVLEAPACEVLNITPLILNDWYGAEESAYWRKYNQSIAAKALRCNEAATND